MTEPINTKHQKRPLMLQLIERFVPAIAWLLVVAGFALEKAAETQMGVYRSLSFRNQLLNAGVFAPNKVSLYMWVILAGLVICLLIYLVSNVHFSKQSRTAIRGSLERRWLSYLLRTSLQSSTLVVMLGFYADVSWLAYPWIILAMIIVLATHYLRIMYAGIYLLRA